MLSLLSVTSQRPLGKEMDLKFQKVHSLDCGGLDPCSTIRLFKFRLIGTFILFCNFPTNYIFNNFLVCHIHALV